MWRVPMRHSVLTANYFPFSCLLQSSIGSKANKRWLCHLRDSKAWNPPWWLKSSFCFWFSLCGTSLSRGGMSESKLLERVLTRTWLWMWVVFLWAAPNGVERKSPVPVPWMASIPPPSFLPRVLSFSSQLRGEVQHWGCLPGRSLGMLVKGSVPCDWWTRLLDRLRRAAPRPGGLQSDCTKLAIRDFCTAEEPINSLRSQPPSSFSLCFLSHFA